VATTNRATIFRPSAQLRSHFAGGARERGGHCRGLLLIKTLVYAPEKQAAERDNRFSAPSHVQCQTVRRARVLWEGKLADHRCKTLERCVAVLAKIAGGRRTAGRDSECYVNHRDIANASHGELARERHRRCARTLRTLAVGPAHKKSGNGAAVCTRSTDPSGFSYGAVADSGTYLAARPSAHRWTSWKGPQSTRWGLTLIGLFLMPKPVCARDERPGYGAGCWARSFGPPVVLAVEHLAPNSAAGIRPLPDN